MPNICFDAGFKFDLVGRNEALMRNHGVKPPKTTSTGTTIVGCKFKNGVILGADKRASAGELIADKSCDKIHHIAPNIWCAGAGTAADTEFVTALISSQIELHALSTGRKSRVVTALTMLKQHLFRYMGYVGAYLVLAGVDPTGIHLFSIQAHGSSDKLPYTTLGSGSLAALAVLETKWKPDMEENDAMELVREAVEAGIWNDLGSGSNVDLCVITAEKTRYLPMYAYVNPRLEKQDSYKFPRGTTAVLKEDIVNIVVEEHPVEEPLTMEVDWSQEEDLGQFKKPNPEYYSWTWSWDPIEKLV